MMIGKDSCSRMLVHHNIWNNKGDNVNRVRRKDGLIQFRRPIYMDLFHSQDYQKYRLKTIKNLQLI